MPATKTPRRTEDGPTPASHASGGAQTPPAPAEMPPTSLVSAPVLGDPFLALYAENVGDLEKVRITIENRLWQLTRAEADKDGIERGFGLTEDHPVVVQFTAVSAGLAALEAQAVKDLQRAMRKHPLAPWVQATPGLGLKQMARLLTAIGDPYWRTEVLNEDGSVRWPEGPRTVSQLWAFCGLHCVPGHEGPMAARRRKGVKANWSTKAKTRAWLVAVSCIKAPTSPYRAVYLARRERTAVTHPDWTAGHSHEDGLRVAAKAMLRDLWRESARLHGIDPDVDLADREAARRAA
jgi:hypothetical protein